MDFNPFLLSALGHRATPHLLVSDRCVRHSIEGLLGLKKTNSRFWAWFIFRGGSLGFLSPK